jgi:ribosome-binding factor A
MTRRTERVGDLLRSELAELILRHVQDPRVSLASVVAVNVSPDLRHAVVRVSVLGDESHREEAIAALQHARGYIRSQLAPRLRLRVVPDLSFKLDRGAEHSQRITDLLEGLDDDDQGA